ncbi:VOC family protein [Sandaracinobacter neustonicus]|uniref:VOC family protein n=1 Tax=Sandaracinobacter neustonicus TaxID=1715348 RepID=A0A501XHR4_9SPHN|nr:VOC family protein [Sandaracinobacter neustonicus]TPE60080.1 VOC family protein [Sandaracinobacter neustonicus]
MPRITSLGGIFYKVLDVDRTRAWYQENLGIGGEWGAMFPYSKDSAEAFSLLSPFKAETDYFAPSDAPFMINLRVDDIDGFVEELEARGIEILGRQDEDYGRFAWILDCDGVKVELWEQLGPAPE